MTAVEIVNLALAMMGVSPLMAFDDPTQVAQTASTIYLPTLKHCLSVHNWNFAMKAVQLAKTASDLPNWQYAFQEPSDVLKIESVRDGDNNAVVYEEINGKIYADADTIILRYVYYYDNIEPMLPPYFIEVLKYKLAADLSIPLKGDYNLYKAYITLYEQALRLARGLDSQRGKVRFVDNSKWLAGLW